MKASNIFLVDDEALIRMMIAEWSRSLGIASSPKRAMSK
jgi:hypothetical protein